MTTLKEYLKPVKIARKCPHCKSTKGVEVNYTIGGIGMMKLNFKGQTIDAEREVFDQMPHDVTCLNCGKLINFERIRTE